MEKINFIMENPIIILLDIIIFILCIMTYKKMKNSENEALFIIIGIMLTIMCGLIIYVSIQGV